MVLTTLIGYLISAGLIRDTDYFGLVGGLIFLILFLRVQLNGICPPNRHPCYGRETQGKAIE
jgi:hypothetical protein